MSQPILSIIIPTKNEAKNIESCLKSIKKQRLPSEIVVIDNYSKDQTLNIAKKYTNLVFKIGNERSKQRNFGLKKASGKYILFLDADMELGADVLSQCVQKIKNSRIVGILIDEIPKGQNFLAKIKKLEKKITQGRKEIEAARFFRKNDLDKIGGFDEMLISGEDWDISQRIQELGKLSKIKAKIYHYEDKSIWLDIRKKYYYAKYIGYYSRKHPREFKKQAGFARFSMLFKNPKIIKDQPLEFMGLLFLKSAQYIVYLIAKIQLYA